MLLKDLKKSMIIPKKEVLINKTVRIRGVEVQLISITMEENRNVLWIIYQTPDCINEEIKEYVCNRDELVDGIKREVSTYNIGISELTIQDQKMTFSSSTAKRIYNMDYEGCMQLQHFIVNGMNTTNLEDVDLSNLCIAAYEQTEGEEFPTIALSKKLNINLKVSKEFHQILINKPMEVKFGDMIIDKPYYFYDPDGKRERMFYINKIEHYDIWKETEERFEDETMKGFYSKEQIEYMKEQYLIGLENICPKGMNLAVIEYETEDDIQLNFYSKEFLDAKPVNTNFSMGVLFTPDQKIGKNGYKNRACMLKAVEKGFTGSIDIELFSWYKEIPEVIIKV